MARKSRRNTDAVQPLSSKKDVFNVGAYIRLSAVDKKHKGDSIETQQSIINAYIAEYCNFELIEIYIDNGLSGQSFDRPAFQRMIADMESGKINCCITKDLSRLGRNAIDTGFYIEKFFPAHGIRFIAITDNYDSNNGQRDGIMLSLKNMVNETYALDIGRKIRATKQMNIRNGCFIGRFPPYGYLKSSEDSHKLIADEYAANIVRQMFEMAADGKGIRAITQWLNDNNILTPRRYFHSIGLATDKEAGGHIHWNKGVIYAILKNRVYCGDMVQGKYKTVQHIQEKLPESEWIVTQNTHESIVSRELFAEVQMLWEQSQERKSQYSEPSTENIFLRKVFCAHCGHTMFRQRNSRTQYYFKCHTRELYDKSDCVPVGINENVLKEKLLVMLREQKIENTVDVIKPVSIDNSELLSVKAELEKNTRFLKGLYESLLLGDITDSEYKDMKADYETKIASLTVHEKQLRESGYARIRQETEYAKADKSINGLRNISDLSADMIDRLVEKIRIFKDKSIEVKFRFMDESVVLKEAA